MPSKLSLHRALLPASIRKTNPTRASSATAVQRLALFADAPWPVKSNALFSPLVLTRWRVLLVCVALLVPYNKRDSPCAERITANHIPAIAGMRNGLILAIMTVCGLPCSASPLWFSYATERFRTMR